MKHKKRIVKMLGIDTLHRVEVSMEFREQCIQKLVRVKINSMRQTIYLFKPNVSANMSATFIYWNLRSHLTSCVVVSAISHS